MEKQHQYSLVLTFITVISLGLATFVSCFIAESKKAQIKDMKVDGKLCYLPGSHAYRYGVVALVCLGIAHVIGNLQVCGNFCSREKRSSNKAKTPAVVTILMIFSWMCFGVAAILITTATSMSRRQAYGQGWLDRECYLVKEGVFIGSGGLALVSLGSTLVAAFLTRRKSYVEQGRRIHAQQTG
ncbi:protein MODIFYING WALL LIGNIN-1-like isoform X2 [Pistacia vera]|uniref:protein MODIFYING WALL LIGNIN-1-like isoform X1 n=1 Tax=Pistacia vera TaxID=55513 RepID=UPI00126349C9|nr:protein MODIFYING WALL LIGNIN-1-like isoform X1 [Pistacia vera]XP_031280114.1 protein MODIFYING WALL LIGNIN-1-like isoform X2 [Pistacia vera]